MLNFPLFFPDFSEISRSTKIMQSEKKINFNIKFFAIFLVYQNDLKIEKNHEMTATM